MVVVCLPHVPVVVALPRPGRVGAIRLALGFAVIKALFPGLEQDALAVTAMGTFFRTTMAVDGAKITQPKVVVPHLDFVMAKPAAEGVFARNIFSEAIRHLEVRSVVTNRLGARSEPNTFSYT